MSDDETILRTNLPLIRALLPTPQGRAVYWAVDEIDRLRGLLDKTHQIAQKIRSVMVAADGCERLSSHRNAVSESADPTVGS